MPILRAIFSAALAAAALFPAAIWAQPAARSLDELKAEAQARADRNAYPLIGLKPADVREALSHLKTLDRDEWAASWSEIGDRYMAQGQPLDAWRYYSFARWPQPNSPGKEKAYAKALEAFLAYARRYDPPVQVVRAPYEA